MWGGLSCTTGVLWVMTTHLTCDRVHCFSVTGSITWTLWGGRWKSTCGAASKVHICASCSGSTQSSPRVEHPTYVSNTAGLIVNKSQLRKTKCSHVTHNKSVFFLHDSNDMCTPAERHRKDIKSLGALCSSVRWAVKSSVTWFGSPPGKAAQMGQIWRGDRKKTTHTHTVILMTTKHCLNNEKV